MAASTWTKERRRQVLGEKRAGDGRCWRGEIADDYHRIGGICPCRPEHPDFDRTERLCDMAGRGHQDCPI
eukprot:4236404-Pyramimonas_sp.AAC.1